MNKRLAKWLKRTPVAWLQVTNNPVKMGIALAGVSFSNLLMFFQLGLLDSIYNSLSFYHMTKNSMFSI